MNHKGHVLAHISRIGHAFFFCFFFFSGPNWTRHANQTGRPSAFGRCLQQQTEGSIEGEKRKETSRIMMPKFQRRSMTPEGNTNKLLFLFSNETLFFSSSKAGRNGHQEIIKLKGGKKAVAHRRYAVSTASPSCSSSSCSSPKKEPFNSSAPFLLSFVAPPPATQGRSSLCIASTFQRRSRRL